MAIDASTYVAPTARVHPDALVGPGCRIGEFCILEQEVRVGAGCVLEPYVYVKRWTSMGDGNEISAGTVLGTDPLDKNFTGERSYLRIGNRNRIREHYTISRGTAPESETVLGDGNYIMTAGHIAHNCRIGSDTVLASCSLVSGYVEIEDQAFVSGQIAIHQFCRIGRLAMIAGGVRVNLDAPPFFLYGGLYIKPDGLNKVGLRRAGFTREQMNVLKQAYQWLYRSGLKLAGALERIEREIPNEHTRRLVEFIRASKRGIARESGRNQEAPE